MTPFIRPHVRACESYVEMLVNLDEFRSIESYDEWLALLKNELQSVYGAAPNNVASVTYSTKQAPTTFASELNEKTYNMVRAFDDAVKQSAIIGKEYEDADAQQKALAEERDPERKVTRKERKQEAEERAAVVLLKKQLAQKQYNIECLTIKLANVFNMYAICVSLM